MAGKIGKFPLIHTKMQRLRLPTSHAVDHESIPKDQRYPRTDRCFQLAARCTSHAGTATLLAQARVARSAPRPDTAAQGVMHKMTSIECNEEKKIMTKPTIEEVGEITEEACIYAFPMLIGYPAAGCACGLIVRWKELTWNREEKPDEK
jgi:hypothetical protein